MTRLASLSRSVVLPVAFAALAILSGSSYASDWPGWRGPARDGHAPPGSRVPDSLPLQPRRVWAQKVGEGLAAPVVAGDRVYYLDAQDGREVVHAVDRKTGTEAWRESFDGTFKNGQTAPGPRCTPLVDGDRIYVQSCNGELQCRSTRDGALRWRVNYTKDYQAGVPAEQGVAKGAQRHGFTAAPWVDGERLIALVGDTHGAGIVCFHKETGAVLWKSQNDRAANAAPITVQFPGIAETQVVAFTVEGLIGLNLQDGALRWRVPITTTYGRHVMTPVVVGNIAMAASKEEALMGIEINRKPDGIECTAETRWQAREHLVNFSSPVATGGHLYGLGPEKNLFCVEVSSGKTRWSRGGFATKPAENAHLALLVLGPNLLALTETGTLILVAADPTAYRELGNVQVCGANWCNPAYADGHLFLRDARELMCIDLLAQP
jgi:outer membrane protein assembly factor BamB